MSFEAVIVDSQEEFETVQEEIRKLRGDSKRYAGGDGTPDIELKDGSFAIRVLQDEHTEDVRKLYTTREVEQSEIKQPEL